MVYKNCYQPKKYRKILFVCNDSVLFGSELALLNILDNMNKKNNDICVLLPRKGDLEFELKKRNISYKIIKYYSWAVEKKDFVNSIKFLIKHIINIISLYKIKSYIKEKKFDIIHSINSCVYFGSLIANKYKIKHVWHFREYNIKYANNYIFNKNIKKCNNIIFISKAVFNHFSKYLSKEQYKIIYDGLNINTYLNFKKKKKKSNYNLLIAGTLNHNKNQILAIKAIEKLKNKNYNNLTLYIAGSGKDEQFLREYVVKHKLTRYIKFLGYRSDLNNIRKNIDIYLMCSLNEGWGYVTIESLLSKNLVIASNIGGSLEIITNKKNGFIFESNNLDSLSNNIEYAINNWKECEKIIEKAYHDAIKKYDIKYTIEQLEVIYRDL